MGKLEIININKSFSKKKVLQNVNLKIEKPGIYALVGPNGCGKTTLFNVIVNLLKADSGSIFINGIANNKSEIFNYLSILKDNTVLYPYLTGLDHLNFIRNVHKLKKEKIDDVISCLNISSYINDRIDSYSLGMKQKLLIAMILLADTDIMILDEPLNGLDPSSILEFRDILKDLENKGKIILISSHSLAELDYITDNIIFLKNGELIFDSKENGISGAEERYRKIFFE